jgi:predicted aldo/keto reductase-like oxidoreductase
MMRVGRRGFVRASAAAAAAAAVGGPSAHALAQEAADAPRVRRFKPLGRTGWKVGDVSAGSGQRDPAVLNYIFDTGINLIDTGFQYTGHEELVGKVLPKWREKVFVLDKWDPPLVTATVTKSALLEALDVSLQRLNTTYVDCMMIHSIGHPRYGGLERIQNPAIYEAWDEAKRLGKVRFTGASSHGVRMIEDMNWGLDNNRFDLILIGANFLTRGVEPLLKKARAKGVGTIAMKTMTTYKLDLNIQALQNEQTNARQACLKWILASDLFDTLVVSMPNYDRVAEYLAVSGTTSLTARDERYLATVEAAVGPRYCRPGCGACHDVCPRGVPVADILRYKMYFEDYGEEKFAMQRYGLVPASARPSRCAGCEAPCEAACPYGLRVRDRLSEADRQLRFA